MNQKTLIEPPHGTASNPILMPPQARYGIFVLFLIGCAASSALEMIRTNPGDEKNEIAKRNRLITETNTINKGKGNDLERNQDYNRT